MHITCESELAKLECSALTNRQNYKCSICCIESPQDAEMEQEQQSLLSHESQPAEELSSSLSTSVLDSSQPPVSQTSQILSPEPAKRISTSSSICSDKGAFALKGIEHL